MKDFLIDCAVITFAISSAFLGLVATCQFFNNLTMLSCTIVFIIGVLFIVVVMS